MLPGDPSHSGGRGGDLAGGGRDHICIQLYVYIYILYYTYIYTINIIHIYIS